MMQCIPGPTGRQRHSLFTTPGGFQRTQIDFPCQCRLRGTACQSGFAPENVAAPPNEQSAGRHYTRSLQINAPNSIRWPLPIHPYRGKLSCCPRATTPSNHARECETVEVGLASRTTSHLCDCFALIPARSPTCVTRPSLAFRSFNVRLSRVDVDPNRQPAGLS